MVINMVDPYEVLGINKNVSDQELKKEYRRLSKQFHPDNNQDNPNREYAEERFKDIQAAYEQIMRERSGDYSGNYYSTHENSTTARDDRNYSSNKSADSSYYDKWNNSFNSDERRNGNTYYGRKNANRNDFHDAGRSYNNNTAGSAGSYGNGYSNNSNAGSNYNGNNYYGSGSSNSGNSSYYGNNGSGSYYGSNNSSAGNNTYYGSGDNGSYYGNNNAYNNYYGNDNSAAGNGNYYGSGNSYTENNNYNYYGNNGTNSYHGNNGYYSGSGYGFRGTNNGSGYGYREPAKTTSQFMGKIADYLNTGRYYQAVEVLNTIEKKDDLWYYYSAVANIGLGNNAKALSQARIACSMKPQEPAYAELVQNIEGTSVRYREMNSIFNPGSENRSKAKLGLLIAAGIACTSCGGGGFSIGRFFLCC
ncbi:MAG: DnaJ domain-containing protein [Lachnospiraceae bacterium]|nr:DnaJ domain-containing protein [Lachnospiraceae bacterium]